MKNIVITSHTKRSGKTSVNMLRYILLLPLLLIILLSVNSCMETSHDTRLEKIAAIVSDSPQEAIARLDSIDPAKLDEHDRHYYDFLSIKALDKAYITHSSDSLIRDIINYYSTHRGSGLYPEVLYYGGRVNKDLGDYPTALRYFQDALDEISDDAEHLQLKGYIVSQTGGLLNQLRLYKQAIPYIEESIKIDSLTNDTFGLAYDHKLIGAIYMHQGEFTSADTHFRQALELSRHLRIKDQVIPKVYLAANQYCMGNIDSALTLIRGLPELSEGINRSFTLTYASRIYLQAGILDTAYMYAHELAYIHCSNQKTGYQLLLSPELSEMVPPDSLRKYVAGFRSSMEEYLNENESTESLIQNSYYNYNRHLHDKERLKASKERIRLVLIITLLFTSILGGIVLYLKYRNTHQALRLRDTLDVVSAISAELTEIKSANAQPRDATLFTASEDDLRQQLLARLEAIEQSGASIHIPEIILKSDLYKTLTTHIEQAKGISGSDPIWQDLEALILTHSPNFKHSLLKLTNGKLSKADLHIAILVRYGISPSGMATLLNITPGSISSRRGNLCKKIFGRSLGTKTIDYIILLL